MSRNIGIYRSIFDQKSEFNMHYFKVELISIFMNNPNYTFKWQGYRGYVASVENGVDNIFLNHICQGIDFKANKPILGIFLFELVKLDSNMQNFIKRYEIDKNDQLFVNPANVKNLIKGIRIDYNEINIYSLIMTGIKIVNKLSRENYNALVFKDDKLKEEYDFFRPLFIPSKLNYYLFIMDLHKIVFAGLCKTGLNKILQRKQISTYIVIDNKKTNKSLTKKIYDLTESNEGKYNEVFLQNLNTMRNIPAHDLYNNDFDEKFWQLQDHDMIETYRFINSLILTLGKGILPKEYEMYSQIYGAMGSIEVKNGLNLKNRGE